MNQFKKGDRVIAQALMKDHDIVIGRNVHHA